MFKGLFDNTEWAGILSTLIFFSVFVIAVIMAITKKKSDVEYMSNLPLDDDEIKELKNYKNDE